MDLKTLLVHLEFPEAVSNIIWDNISEKENEIRKISELAYSGEDFNFSLLKYTPETYLTVVTYLLLNKFEEYRAKGVPESIIIETFRDVSLRSLRYFQRTGTVGLTKDDVIWFRHIMNVNIFKIGVLQFQPFKMIYLDEQTIGEPYMEFSDEQKTLLPSGTPVINCHIQYGADLRSAGVDRSFSEAKKFFTTTFPNTQYSVFLCYSWLLYPPMVNQLSEKSHIRGFANRFNIIGSCNDSDQALAELDRSRHSQLTSLSSNAFGFACGIIEF